MRVSLAQGRKVEVKTGDARRDRIHCQLHPRVLVRFTYRLDFIDGVAVWAATIVATPHRNAPDSLLGAADPQSRQGFAVPLGSAVVIWGKFEALGSVCNTHRTAC